jgi:tetratricopeptide (TPR) repeat protein
MSDEMKLRALFDSLADSVDEVSDDDLVAEAVGIGRSSQNIANETRSILMAAVQQVDQRSTVLLGTGETSSMSSPASVPLPTAQGELPDFHALDPLAFQGLCRDLYQVEPNISTAEVFGTSGQSQRGVDIVAFHRTDGAISVGQCKRIEAKALTVKLIRAASAEFLEHIDYWRGRQVRRFVLFVAPDASRKQITEEHLRQRSEFRRLGIEYELWGQATIVSKLRPHPGIARTFLRDPWTEILCGAGVFGFPKESVLVNSVLLARLDVLSTHVSTAAEAEIERLRLHWREGKRADAATGIARLREPGRWQAFPPQLQAAIARFEAQLALETEDLPRAQTLADEAEELDPAANLRLRALIARRRSRLDEALSILGNSNDVDAVTLKAGLLLESGRVTESQSLLERLAGVPEAHRLRALGYVLQHDLARARLEIDKAAELAPTWVSVLYSKSIVYYLSGLSLAALPDGLPSWPEPEHWEFVNTDDESRGFFRRASEAIEQIPIDMQVGDERRVYESWRLAAIANDPERRDEANEYCREIIARDPGHYRAVVWATARRLDVDLSQSMRTLEKLLTAAQISVPEIVALVLLRVKSGDHAAAAELLMNTRERFVESGAEALWALWRLQVAAAAGTSPADFPDIGPQETPQSVLVRLRARAVANGAWDELIAELQTRHDSGDGQASFELCRLLGSRQRWEEAAVIARTLMPSVSSGEALQLASATLYNAADFAGALQLLDAHRGAFPHGEFPSDMRRLRLFAQRHLGMLPTAAAEAEDLFRREPSKTHFSLLADVYFQKGDFRRLAVLARQHEQFTDLSTSELLRLAMRIGVEDRVLAKNIWRRAASMGFPDDLVTVAVDVGYRLGLDTDLRTLLQRMMQLAGGPGSAVQRLGLDEVRAMLAARRDDAERIYGMYRGGKIPIHLLAQYLNRPVAWWYRRAPIINQASGRSDAGPTLTRAGWRIGESVKFEKGTRLRLHADTTALLTAQHLGVLEELEAWFAPIRLPHSTPVALAHMRDSTVPHQPARRVALQAAFDLVTRQSIGIVPADELVETPITGDERLLALAKAKGALLVDILPLTGPDAVPLELSPEDTARVRTAHSVVAALKSLGELSDEEAVRAFDALGPEHIPPSVRDIPRGTSVLCSAGILEQLAAGGALPAAARAFSLQVLRDDFDTLVRGQLDAFAVAEADAVWLTELIDRINTGIEQGVYELLPELEHVGPIGESAEESPALGCLLDLLRLMPVEGDVIWVDDRWATGFVHKDGAPVLDTFDLIHILRDRGAISDASFAALTHAFRDADLRFFALDLDELKNRTRQAVDQNQTFRESKELRTLRRQYARCVASGADLAVTPRDGVAQLEWPYLLESGRAVVDGIVEVWGENESDDVSRQRSEWILRNLYVPDRGRGFTVADAGEGVDHHLEATALTALLSHPISLASTDTRAQEKRRRYLEWIFERLIRRRVDADPKLATSVVDSLRSVLMGALESSPLGAEHSRVAKALVRQLVADLPEDLSSRLAEDPVFLAALDVSRTRLFRIGPHQVNADAFWKLAVEVVRSGSDDTMTANGRELVIKLDQQSTPAQLIVQDTPARKQYLLLANELGILADSVAAREATLRTLAPSFDLPRTAADANVARIALIKSPGDRVMEVARLKRASSEHHYRELERKVSQHESVDASDFLLEDVEALTRHLRMSSGADAFTTKLDEAASVLLDEVGLRDAIIRLAGVPSPLPSRIHETVQALSSDARRELLGSLSRSLAASPIGSAHLARICALAGAERPSYARYVRRWVRRTVHRSLDIHTEAWREVLRVCASELGHVEAFRQLPVDVRLCLVWAHGDRIFRILANANANEEWIRDKFGGWSSRLPAEIAFADAAYLAEASHPQHVDLLSFALAAIAYVLGENNVDDALRVEVSRFIESEPARLLALLQQPGLRTDSLESILCTRALPARLALLTPPLAERVGPTTLMSQVAAALDATASGQTKEPWLVLRAILNDQEVPSEFIDRVRLALSSMNLTAIYRQEKGIAIIAAVFASQQAPYLGGDVVSRVREQLIALTREVGAEAAAEEHVVQALLSCPIYIYSRADTDQGSRFAHIAQLFEEMAALWPRLMDRMQYLVDRLVEGLPNHHARSLWALQVKLRALR